MRRDTAILCASLALAASALGVLALAGLPAGGQVHALSGVGTAGAAEVRADAAIEVPVRPVSSAPTGAPGERRIALERKDRGSGLGTAGFARSGRGSEPSPAELESALKRAEQRAVRLAEERVEREGRALRRRASRVAKRLQLDDGDRDALAALWIEFNERAVVAYERQVQGRAPKQAFAAELQELQERERHDLEFAFGVELGRELAALGRGPKIGRLAVAAVRLR